MGITVVLRSGNRKTLVSIAITFKKDINVPGAKRVPVTVGSISTRNSIKPILARIEGNLLPWDLLCHATSWSPPMLSIIGPLL